MDAGGMSHKVTLAERKRLEITGVEDVESFDESEIVMSTCQGGLTVRGEGLHIETLSLEGGALRVEGEVESLAYSGVEPEKGGLWSRLFH